MQSRENAISFLHIYILLVLLGILLMGVFSSCQKDDNVPVPDPVPPVDQPCEFTMPSTGVQLPPAIVDSMYFSAGSVNPNNPDEIIFLYRKDSKVYKLNYRTGEKNVVLQEGMSYSWADWSVKDWILFTRFQNLYKVKSNGDSLTQITFNGVGWLANWNPSGEKYTYVTSSPETGLIRVISDLHDEVIDTLPVVINSSIDWYSDSIFFWGRGSYVLGNDSLNFHLPAGPSGDVVGISTTESLHLRGGLLHLNRETGVSTQVHPNFPSCYSYIEIDYSHQKNKLLTSRLYRSVMPDGKTVYLKGEIVWLNLDGTVHEVINIARFMDE